MTEPMPEAVTWGLAALLLATAVLLLRQHGISRRQRGRSVVLADGLRARDEELRHMVLVRLPALADSSHQPVPGPLDARLADTEFAKGLDEILARFSGAVEHAQARADQSAKAALKASMRSIQALANEQQVSISEMQERHDRPDVLRDLMEIDHTNAQFGRRAQAIAVLCGSWPGRQRATSPLVEVVRGATSRIRDYRRVRVTGQVDLAVESRAVEPVVLAVAELLDNAARHSQPGTHVEVNVQAVHNGACVVIDDAGVGMDGQAVERAGELLSGRISVDVTRLDDPPQFGFSVIGVLARRYGFSVSVDTRSPYGGVRAVVFVPSGLLTYADTPAPKPVVVETPARRTPAPAPEPEPESVTEFASHRTEPEGTTMGGLPKRRRRTPSKAATPPSAPASASTEDAPTRSPEENARIMGAFARGTRFGREAGERGERTVGEAQRRETPEEPVPPAPETAAHEPVRDGAPGASAALTENAPKAAGDDAVGETDRFEAALEAIRRAAAPESAPETPRYEPVWEVLGKEPEPERNRDSGAVRDDPAPQEATQATRHHDEGTPHA
ncbi:sensor histidine kinase [Streptomyces sp. K1PN6]|uniref:histidine kinase n=1 Tax=Streptomyces acidicola TaxID=2596892 RepID=A0A5N8WQ47_9ACTN|nr:sensor histidine kinase [Streptomyces acidicola]